MSSDAPFLVVDMSRVLNESEGGRLAVLSLEKLKARRDQEREKVAARYQKAVGANRGKLRDAFIQLERKTREEFERRKAAFRDQLFAAAEKVVAAIAAERSVDVVLDKSQVIVSPPELDITDEVIARLDKKKTKKRAAKAARAKG